MRDEGSLTASKRHARLAARQHGLLKACQLSLTRGGVAKRVANGTLYRKYRGVYAYGHARLSRKGEWLAAVFAAGDGVALASGGAFWEISRFKETEIEVVAPGR